METKYIINANVICENDIIYDGVIEINKDIIYNVFKKGEKDIDNGAEIIDANGAYVGPGFVDIHVHGGDIYKFDTEPSLASQYFLKHGTTTILATFYTDLNKEGLLNSIEKVRRAMNTDDGKTIAGIYFECPYTNVKYGSNPELNCWRGEINEEDFKPWVNSANELMRVVAVAPEREGVEKFMEYVKSVNPATVFTVAHSEANVSEVQDKKKYGIKILTHCTNATGRKTEWSGTRGCGPDEACFLDDEMYAELICDSAGIHVCPDLMKLIIKIKGIDKVILITDSFVSDKPSPEGFSHIDDLSFDSRGKLSGSKLTMDKACRNFKKHTGCSIRETFLTAATNPSKAIGVYDEVGSIKNGKKANLVFVDENFNIQKVLFEGKEVEL